MKRRGIHRPTIEDAIEISGIEILHPGGLALTRATARLTQLKPGLKVLDVSSGRGTNAILYAREYGVQVVGIDISPDMVRIAQEKAEQAGFAGQVSFEIGDSQNLPFEDGQFDVVINECAVGIPDDSQRVLDEMVRVLRPGGTVAIHESIWKRELSVDEKDELAERYGTTPLECDEWLQMLTTAGIINIVFDAETWSRPEMFWKIRQNRDVEHHSKVMTFSERMTTVGRLLKTYGIKGPLKAFANERVFYQAILEGKIGYSLFKGEKTDTVRD